MDILAKRLSGRLGRAGAAVAMALVLATAIGAGAAAARVDLNSATLEQLTTLPGIGMAKAAAIIEERGIAPFTSVDDLERVKGIGASTVADLRDRATVSKKD